MENIYLGRQPIYDRQLKVHAYELLFRGDGQNQANVLDGNCATSRVILSALLDLGIEAIAGSRPVFINLTHDFIIEDGTDLLPSDKVVLEILEDVVPDAEVVAALQRLRARGFTIALDDFLYDQATAPLAKLAHILKFDVLSMDELQLANHVRRAKAQGLKVLAEKVEDADKYGMCRKLDFDYYQGYHFARPNIIAGKRPPANRLACLQLLSKLQHPGTEFGELEKIIMQDATLSFRTLKLVNSAYTGIPRKVESIKSALQLLGMRQIRNIATLIAFSRIDDKPGELLRTALVRARMAEQLAETMKLPRADSHFTVGLFSILDALLDMRHEEIMAQLPLKENVKRAIVAREGEEGEVLRNVIAYEQGRWNEVRLPAGVQTPVIYLDSVRWADQSAGLLG